MNNNDHVITVVPIIDGTGWVNCDRWRWTPMMAKAY